MDRPFIPGLKLCELFYYEAVRPVLDARFPDVPHSAARLGGGSDVLGFDTPQSRDHDWGPRLTLFLSDASYEQHREAIDLALRRDLPPEIHGYPTNFGWHEDGTTWMVGTSDGVVRHHVTISTVRSFFLDYVRYDPRAGEPTLVEWLTFPRQCLRTIASGRVFYDGLGELQPVCDRLRYYPRDLWLYLLAVQWQRISQEEAFVARCGDVGDELGSRLIATRLVGELMGLCFLMERQYAPYSKWFGTAFARLDCAAGLSPLFERVLDARTWREREAHLSAAYKVVIEMHNALRLTDSFPAQVSRFHERPYLVPHSDAIAEALREAIVDQNVRALPTHLGSVDQFVDSTDVLSYPRRFARLRSMYELENEME